MPAGLPPLLTGLIMVLGGLAMLALIAVRTRGQRRRLGLIGMALIMVGSVAGTVLNLMVPLLSQRWSRNGALLLSSACGGLPTATGLIIVGLAVGATAGPPRSGRTHIEPPAALGEGRR